jgi:hypothetical protein
VGDVPGILIFAAISGLGVTLLVTAGLGWLAEPRRLARAFHAGLEVRPDASLIAHGTGRGVAVSLFTGHIVTVWDRGRWRLAYPLEALIGAELELDGEVAARVMRGEARRRLERSGGVREDVRLRLLFDDPRHPDFELALWPCRRARGAPETPRGAVTEANRWIGRVEAMLKRSGQAVVRAAPATIRAASPDPELFEDDEDEDVLAN